MIYVYRNTLYGSPDRNVPLLLVELPVNNPSLTLLGTIPLQPVQPEPERDMDDNEILA